MSSKSSSKGLFLRTNNFLQDQTKEIHTVSTLCAGTCPGHRDIPISQKTNCSHTEFLLPGHGGFCGFEDTVLSARTGRACVPVVKTAGIYRTAGDYRRKVALDSKNPTIETGR